MTSSPGFIAGTHKPGLPPVAGGKAEVRKDLSPKAAALPLIMFPNCALSSALCAALRQLVGPPNGKRKKNRGDDYV